MNSDKPFDFAIDPGISVTGYTVWQNRQFVACGSIRPPAKVDMIQRLEFLGQKINDVFVEYMPVGTIIIEKFEGFVSRHMLAMMKTSEARAAIIMTALKHGEKVMEISKGRISKDDAKTITQHAGIIANKHINDAVILAAIGNIAHFNIWRKTR